MKKDKDCGCKAKQNAEKVINDVYKTQGSNGERLNKRSKGMGYLIKTIFYTFMLLFLVLSIFPFFLYIIFNRKPIIIKNINRLR